MVFRSWHMKVCRKNASTYSWALVSLLTLCMLEPGCASLGPAGLEPAPSTDSGEHLALLVQGFFARLEGRNADAGGIDRLLAEYPLAFSLAEDGDPSPDGLRSWMLELRSPHPEVEYQLGEIRIDAVDAASYRVHFQLDRHAVDRQGIPHVARSEHTWLIRSRPESRPAVLRVDTKRLLAFPGTGPQIVCY